VNESVGVVKSPAVAAFSRHRRVPLRWQAVLLVVTCLATGLAVNHFFNLGFFVGYTLLENHYQYALVGLLAPFVFVIFPAHAAAPVDRVPWYDGVLFVAMMAVTGFFVVNSQKILDLGWEFGAPDAVVFLCYVLWLLLLEVTRRAGGTALFLIVTVVSLYPIYADQVWGPLSGLASPIGVAAAYHIMSNESMLGIPMRALANLVIGFVIFGVALTHTGGGKFFINLAFALLGHVRGGPAKVAIFASGLMGSMSGSVISNVVTTGVMTIPAMKRIGFSASYAGGVEACASTGAVLMPPVMGATAFVMAVFLDVPYITIAIAAIIPSLLYYFGLFVQIDAYAARNGLPGMLPEDLPRVRDILREGWHFIAVFVLLTVMLVVLQREVLAPFYATALLIAVNQIKADDRWTWKSTRNFIIATGILLAEITAILAGVGLIVGALSVTGMAGTFVNDLVFLAGGDTLILLLMGALTSFILGIGMTVTAAYIFLAIVLAPALVQGGLDPLAVHMFIFYWSMVSFITPPVALGAYAAAAIAGANPMRTGLEAVRLGSIIYFIPFFFVFNTAFILRAPVADIVLLTTSAALGIVLIAGALQGYLVGVGNLTTHATTGWLVRALILVGGIFLATPSGGPITLTDFEMMVIALSLSGPGIVLARWLNLRAARAAGPA